MGYLVDSNVLIDYSAARFTTAHLIKLDAIFDVELNVSIITKIETLGFNIPPAEEKTLLQLFGLANIITLTDDIAKQTIQIRKTIRLKTPDAIIAATAIVNNHVLITYNVRDFKNIPSIQLIDPYDF